MTDKLLILHAADLHLDSGFAGLSPDRASVRRGEQRELLEDIFALAHREKVQLMLLSGDLLDSDDPYYETCDALRTLCAQSGAKVVIAPGNHDYYSQSSPYGAMVWPDNVYIFKSSKISAFEFPELGCRVYGAAFNRPQSGPMLEGFQAKDDGMINLMCIHGSLLGDSYGPIAREDIENSGLDYLALGHIHSFSGIQQLGTTAYAYPGCPEGRGFDETGDKGVILGTVGRKTADLHFVSTARRKYQVLTADITNGDPLETITQALPEDTHADIYRIILRGRTQDPPQVQKLAEALEDRFFGLEIQDKTQRLEDIWSGLDQQTLRGEFLRRMRAIWAAAADDKERENAELAVRFGLAALDRREAPRA